MAKTWVLDSETKGTGAHVKPLGADAARKREPELELVTLERAPRVAKAPAPVGPRQFKVVDVLGARALAEGVDTRAVVDLLGEMRSVLDARIYVRSSPTARWRLLTLAEHRELWGFRGQPSRA